MQLKADLHIHTCEDTDNKISYSAKELIDCACKKGFDVISITNHDILTYSPYLRDYAKERGIILIPGSEISINNKHVLILNISDCKGIKSFDNIKEMKSNDNLIIAPHPYFPGMQSIGNLIDIHAELFDAVEFCHFYSQNLNFNREAIRFSKKHNIPMIANSDAHLIEQFGRCYSYIDSEKDITSIINAIKKGRITYVAPPLTIAKMVDLYLKIILNKTSFSSIIKRLTGIAIRLAQIKKVSKRIS